MKLIFAVALLALVFAAEAAIPLSDPDFGSAADDDLELDNDNVSAEEMAIGDSDDLEVEEESGNFPKAIVCQPGSGPFYSPGASPRCVVCSAGTFSTGVKPCAKCPAGSTSVAKAASCTRIVCSAGSAPSSAGLRCVDCQAGTFSDGSSACTKCPAGFFSAAKAASCTQCSAGFFAASPGSSTCTPCPIARYNVAAGSSACASCPSNQVTLSTGASSQSACQTCPPGSTYAWSFYGAVCAKCSTNTYWDAATQKCQSCPAGTEFAGTGATSIKSCTQCPAGSSSPWGQAGVSCATCSAGSFARAPGQTKCQFCPRGTFGTTTGATACTPCPENTYGMGEGAQKCVNCPDGSFSIDGLNCCSAKKWNAVTKTCSN